MCCRSMGAQVWIALMTCRAIHDRPTQRVPECLRIVLACHQRGLELADVVVVFRHSAPQYVLPSVSMPGELPLTRLAI